MNKKVEAKVAVWHPSSAFIWLIGKKETMMPEYVKITMVQLIPDMSPCFKEGCTKCSSISRLYTMFEN